MGKQAWTIETTTCLLLLVWAIASGCEPSPDEEGEPSDGGASVTSDAEAGRGAAPTTGDSAITSPVSCGAIVVATTDMARALGCMADDGLAETCDQIYVTELCVEAWESLWVCALQHGVEAFRCGDDGELEMADDACSAEQSTLDALARGPGAGCLEPRQDSDLDAGASTMDTGSGPEPSESGAVCRMPKPESNAFPGPCTELIDDRANGTIDRMNTYAYDDQGNLTMVDLEAVMGGVNGRLIYMHDADGNLIVIENDSGQNGIIDARTVNNYEGGKLILVEEDERADGTIDSTTAYTYDAFGRVLSEEEDTDADGEVESTWTYEYSDGGCAATVTIDGSYDEIRRITYNEFGDPLSIEYDFFADGSRDATESFGYDENGHLTGHSEGDHRYTYTLDDEGNRLTEEFDQGRDGTPDRILTSTYECWQ